MFKNIFFSLLAFTSITLTSCDLIKETIADVSISPSVLINSLKISAVKTVGESATQEILVSNDEITAALTANKVSNKQVKEIKVTGFELQIPDVVAWDFSAIESATVEIEGVLVGTMPAGAKGKTITFAAPANQTDLKTAFLANGGFKVKFTGKMRSETTEAVLTGKVLTKLIFNLGL
jgi:hypothetical protein